jgi:hypothetical protein
MSRHSTMNWGQFDGVNLGRFKFYWLVPLDHGIFQIGRLFFWLELLDETLSIIQKYSLHT